MGFPHLSYMEDQVPQYENEEQGEIRIPSNHGTWEKWQALRWSMDLFYGNV